MSEMLVSGKQNIAIITVFNNAELVEQMMKTVAESAGTLSCNFYAIDNTGNARFNSAAAAYNSILDVAPDEEVLVFCHQDILFLRNSIQTIYDLCINNINTLFGSAGVKNDGKDKRIISSMAEVQEGNNFKTLQKQTTMEVFTLDECLICGNRVLFETMRFDEQVCDGWHLYAAELCMQCHVQGIEVKVFDADIVHLSRGSVDSYFFACERRLVKKYRKCFPVISYSCGWTYTNPLLYNLLLVYRRLRYGKAIENKR